MRNRRRRSRSAALLLALLVLGPLLGGLHHALVPHEACERDGALAHGHGHAPEARAGDAEPGAAPELATPASAKGHGEHCPLASAFQRRDALLAQRTAIAPLRAPLDRVPLAPLETDAPWRPVHRYAPKQSPPGDA